MTPFDIDCLDDRAELTVRPDAAGTPLAAFKGALARVAHALAEAEKPHRAHPLDRVDAALERLLAAEAAMTSGRAAAAIADLAHAAAYVLTAVEALIRQHDTPNERKENSAEPAPGGLALNEGNGGQAR